jgi:hypothetical protein
LETPRTVTPYKSEKGSCLEFGKVQAIEVGTKTKIRLGPIKRETRVGGDLDNRKCPQQIKVTGRNWMAGEAPHCKC